MSTDPITVLQTSNANFAAFTAATQHAQEKAAAADAAATSADQITARNSVLPISQISRPGLVQRQDAARSDGALTGTLGGYAWYVPAVAQAFTRVTVPIRAYRNGARGTLRNIDWSIEKPDGTVLFSGTLPALLSLDTATPVQFDLTGNVAPGQAVVMRLKSEDGGLSLQPAFDEDNAAPATYGYETSPGPGHWVAQSSHVGYAARYELVDLSAPASARLTPTSRQLVQTALVSQRPAPQYLQEVARLGSTVVFGSDGNQYTSFGWAASSVPDCRYVEVDLYSWFTGAPVTWARLTVRSGNTIAGPIVAQVERPVSLKVERYTPVQFDLGGVIGAGNQYLTLETDGAIYVDRISPDLTGVGPSFYQLKGSTTWVQFGSTVGLNARFYGAGTAVQPDPMPGLRDAIQAEMAQPPALVVPRRLYAIVGEELSVYPAQMFLWPEPRGRYRQTVENIPTTAIYVNGRFAWTPASGDVGTANGLLLNIYDEFNHLVSSVYIQITVSARTAGAGVTRKNLSITDSHGRFGVWPSEVKRLLNNMGGLTFDWLGSQLAERKWDGTTPGDLYNESYPGVNIRDMFQNSVVSGVPNPFYNPGTGTFDFAYFMGRAPGIVFSSGDWVTVFHGTNTANRARIDAEIERDMLLYEELARQVRLYNASLRVGFGTVLPLANAPGDHDGRWYQHYASYSLALTKRFDGRTAEGIYLIPHGHALDRDWGFPRRIQNRSARSGSTGDIIRSGSLTETVCTDTTHPRLPVNSDEIKASGFGYYQVADSDAAFYKALL